MIRNALIASVIALGTSGAALAQDAGPWLIGGGENTEVVYIEPSHNTVGGGAATITGGANDLGIAYDGTTTQAPSGLVAELIGGGENRQLVYHPVAPIPSQQASQPARHGG